MLPWDPRSGMRRALFATDVAMVGAWDASRQMLPIRARGDERHRMVREDAAKGQLFFAETRADCGGLIGVFVDEPIPSALARYFAPVPTKYRLVLTTGALVVDGVEHYRSEEGGQSKAIEVPPGDYGISILVANHTSSDMDDDARRVVLEEVGEANVELHDRASRWLLGLSLAAGITGCAGLLWLGVMPLLAFFGGFLLMLGAAHPIQWTIERLPGLGRLNQTVAKRRIELEPPMFLLRLTRLDEHDELAGGFVDLAAVPGESRDSPG